MIRLLLLLIFFSAPLCADNWWNGCLDVSVSQETLISWWGDENAPSRQAVRRHLASQDYSSLLDVGFGLLTDYAGFRQAGFTLDYCGVEAAEKFYTRALNFGVNATFSSVEELAYEDESFDISYMRFLLEHLPSYKKALKEMIRVARQEVLVVFFIKPHISARDRISRTNDRGYFLHHNHYSRPSLEKFLHAQPRVRSLSWETVNEKEEILHIFLRSKSSCPEAALEEEIAYPEGPKKFVFVTPSYNNSAFVAQNLRSVFEQRDQNWRMIYIDDCSTDDTFAKAQSIIREHGRESQVELIRNEKRCGALENLYRAIHSCSNDEIVLTLDGDDWLAGPNVLNILANVYQDPYIWITYGSYLRYPQNWFGDCCAMIPTDILYNYQLRGYSWVTSHLRTFYAGLFKKIKLEDLLYHGKTFPMSWDQAIMFPMIEMALDHSQYIPEVLYIYNESNPLNDFKVSWELTAACAAHARSLPPYLPLEEPPMLVKPAGQEYASDLLIFSFDRPLQLYAFLESLFRYGRHMERISVICRFSDSEYQSAYREVQKAFPSVVFQWQSREPHADFKPLVLNASFAQDSPSDFITFAVDDIVLTDEIDFKACALALDAAGAYGFYFRLAPHLDFCYPFNEHQAVPYLLSLGNKKLAWQFQTGERDWRYPNSLDLVLYRKADIQEDFEQLSYENPNELEGKWDRLSPLKKIGLCYETTKMVNIPFNIVNISLNRYLHSYSTDALLEKFQTGWKLDISPLYQIRNKAAHIEYEPTFIPR